MKRNLCFITLFIIFCISCTTQQPYVKDIRSQPLLHIPICHLISQDGEALSEKRGIIVRAYIDKIDKSILNEMFTIYSLRLRITNSAPSILEIDPKKIFVRAVEYPNFFFERITGETLLNELAYQKSKNKDYIERFLFLTQLPRGSYIEGMIWFKTTELLTGDNILVQAYIGGEEFIFRFAEADWRILGESGHVATYYNAKSISSIEGIVKVWTLVVAKSKEMVNSKIEGYKLMGVSTKGYENYRYTMVLDEINCDNKMARPISPLVDYDEIWNPLNTFFSSSSVDWTNMDSGDMPALEHLYKAVCP